MKILPFQTQSQPHRAVSFGYNKKLDRELEEKLKHDNSETAAVIKNLRNYCNTTEDTIKKAEKNKNSKLKFHIILDSFMASKYGLADLVEDSYPELNFRKREAKSYEIEGAKIPQYVEERSNYWRLTLASMLSAKNLDSSQQEHLDLLEARGEAVSSSEEKDLEKKPDPLEAISISMKALVNIMAKQNEPVSPPKSPKKDESSDVIVPFVPKDGSPKGFVSVGGMDDLKETLKDRIIDPLLHPKKALLDLKEYGKKFPRAVLFYGPPGCGKTFITEALAQESRLPLYYLKISKAGSEYINKTSKNYEKAFEEAAKKAKDTKKPVIMFIDEIDGMTKGRGQSSGNEDLKQVSTLLDLISTARSRNILVIAATNKFDIMDDAIKRRFDEQIYIGFPDENARKSVLSKALEPREKAQKLLYDSSSMDLIAKKTEGFSSDDLCILADKASYLARKDGRRDITLSDFEKVIEENQGRKIKEDRYVPQSQRKPIGFNRPKKV